MPSGARLYSSRSSEASTEDYFEQSTDAPTEPTAKDDEISRQGPEEERETEAGGWEAPWNDENASPSEVSEAPASKAGEVASVLQTSDSQSTGAGFEEEFAADAPAPAPGFQSLSTLFPPPRPSPSSREDYRFTHAEESSPKGQTPRSIVRNPTEGSPWRRDSKSREDYRSVVKERRPESGRWSMGRPGAERRSMPSASSKEVGGGSNAWRWEQRPEEEEAGERKAGSGPNVGSPSQQHSTPVTSSVVVRRIGNPFDTPTEKRLKEGSDFRRLQPPGIVQTKAESPWGLSPEDQVGVESFLEPGSQDAGRQIMTKQSLSEQQASLVARREKKMALEKPSDTSATLARAPASSRKSGAVKLTHLTSSGEAHMVDVGAKESTRRVAVAFGYVRFSNVEPHRLIKENANKKGDVLGVARIAGIMAAKRTSDIVPLCHPLALTKVEVDVQLHEPGASQNALWKASKSGGLVTIQAVAECTGPTGVEMEALSALSGAALTVYDMCKAVDKRMEIQNAKVVYKSGGRSGTINQRSWVDWVGPDFFKDRGLEVVERDLLQVHDGTKAAKSPAEGFKNSNPELQAKKVEAKASVPPTKLSPIIRRTTSSVEERAMYHARAGGKEDYGSLWTPTPALAAVKQDAAGPLATNATASNKSRSSPPSRQRTCKICGTVVENRNAMNRHFIEKHATGGESKAIPRPRDGHETGEQPKGAPTPPTPKDCQECGMSLPSMAALVKHLEAEHEWSVEVVKDYSAVEGEKGIIKYGSGLRQNRRVYRPPASKAERAGVAEE